MSRYFILPKAASPFLSWDEDYPLLPTITVPDHVAVETGLVDKHGAPIMRSPNPLGFGRDGEW